ncbi:heterogeneous nuclear ribonucleoprotein A0-like [Watersipora subatra]|uniref:heterogeneous nuclear ribonucleoprotein A0-like n=1 Tax=Watersipora subatra TaxID=2589382 RepID=UPI00355B49B8
MADLEAEHLRKVFIGGLHPETDDEAMKSYFSKYGEILDCIVMKDSQTRRSRGFGFVAFDKSECVDRLQADRPHSLGGKRVDTKRVVPKETSQGRSEREQKVNKVFLGGLRDQITEDDLTQYFSQFGTIERVETFTDKETSKRKGFCFITFQDFDAVDKCVLQAQTSPEGKLNLQGFKVEVKKAKSQDEMRRGGGRGGRGGFSRGDYGQGFGNQSNYGGGYNSSGNFNQGGGYSSGGFNQAGGVGGGDGYGNSGGSGSWGGNQQQSNWDSSSSGGGFQNANYAGGSSGGYSNSGSYGGGSTGGYGSANSSGYNSGTSGGYGNGSTGGYGSGGYGTDTTSGYGNSTGGGPIRGFNKPSRTAPYSNSGGSDSGSWNRN